LKKVTITLDNEQIDVAAGTTILEAAKARGIFIPTFCHAEELAPKAACFVCVVEVAGQSDLLPSCSTEVVEGMEIATGSRRVEEARRTCVELLLSDHLGDCVGPCMSACPAGIDIPGFISHLAEGKSREALELIKHDMPLPAILGRVCKKPCEDACRRQLVEKPISICHLKRYAADVVSDREEYIPRKAPATDKKVAIVGSGPSGLTAAYYLQLLGHSCTVFDAHPAPGGMLRYGIPNFRLPGEVIDREVEVIARLGAEFKHGTSLGEDITLRELRGEYDAVFLGLGAQKPLTLQLAGEEAKGVISGLGFLAEEDGKGTVGKKVIVIGGGDVAIDAARVALRKGGEEVHLYCLEQEAEMPAGQLEIEEARAEGITIHPGLGVKEIAVKGANVTGVELKQCTSVFDAKGAFNPAYDEDATGKDSCDTLIVAIGQEVVSPTRFTTCEQTLQTDLEGVFAGGDCVTGPSNAVRAVEAGRKAAISIDQYVLGKAVVGDPACYRHTMGELSEVPEGVTAKYEKEERVRMPSLSAKARKTSYDEIETGLTEELVLSEAKRCMACGCRDAHECKLRSYATLFDAEADRYQGQKREYNLDASHPEIVYESNKCIQCLTCVRITEELLGTSSLTVVGRGFTARVKPSAGGEMALVKDAGLTRIVDSCPVGALTLKGDKVPILEPVFKRPGVPC
jgi:formate dehydrogenase major subunit